jgi:hypothetical protein
MSRRHLERCCPVSDCHSPGDTAVGPHISLLYLTVTSEIFGRDSPPSARVVCSHRLTLWRSRRSSRRLRLRFVAGFGVGSHICGSYPITTIHRPPHTCIDSTLPTVKPGTAKPVIVHAHASLTPRPWQIRNRSLAAWDGLVGRRCAYGVVQRMPMCVQDRGVIGAFPAVGGAVRPMPDRLCLNR